MPNKKRNKAEGENIMNNKPESFMDKVEASRLLHCRICPFSTRKELELLIHLKKHNIVAPDSRDYWREDFPEMLAEVEKMEKIFSGTGHGEVGFPKEIIETLKTVNVPLKISTPINETPANDAGRMWDGKAGYPERHRFAGVHGDRVFIDEVDYRKVEKELAETRENLTKADMVDEKAGSLPNLMEAIFKQLSMKAISIKMKSED